MNENKLNRKFNLKRVLKDFIWILFVVSMFYYVIKISPREYCKELKKEKFSGKVLKKYVDLAQHNYQWLVYTKGEGIDSNEFNTDLSGFYDYVEINDSIIKIENSYEIMIVNKDTSFFVNFNCDYKE